MSDEKKYGCAGCGSIGEWDVSVDEELNEGTFSLVVDHEGMTISDDGSQVQIEIGEEAEATIKDLIDALEQARKDL